MLGQRKGFPWRYAWFIMAYYVSNAVHQGYISKYFKDGGIDGARLTALLAAVPPAVAAAAPEAVPALPHAASAAVRLEAGTLTAGADTSVTAERGNPLLYKEIKNKRKHTPDSTCKSGRLTASNGRS